MGISQAYAREVLWERWLLPTTSAIASCVLTTRESGTRAGLSVLSSQATDREDISWLQPTDRPALSPSRGTVPDALFGLLVRLLDRTSDDFGAPGSSTS